MELDLEFLKKELAALNRKLESLHKKQGQVVRKIAGVLLRALVRRSKSELDDFLARTAALKMTDEEFNQIIDLALDDLQSIPITVKLAEGDIRRLDRDEIKRLRIELEFLRRRPNTVVPFRPTK